MPVICTLALAISFAVGSLLAVAPAPAQIAIGISVNVAPPALPVYVQPPIPSPGYIWAPGYWAWDDEVGYYWVPGTWVSPPREGLLWTPGYWGWADGVYSFHAGYWGPTVGFYGGVAYGFGYTGAGFEGAYWQNGALFYNRSVSNFGNVSITNVYNKTVVNSVTNVSYNGGTGGTTATPTPAQLAAANEQHVAPTAAQTQHAQAAAKDPSLALNNNQGHPTVAATAMRGSSRVPAWLRHIPVRRSQPYSRRATTSVRRQRLVLAPPRPRRAARLALLRPRQAQLRLAPNRAPRRLRLVSSLAPAPPRPRRAARLALLRPHQT